MISNLEIELLPDLLYVLLQLLDDMTEMFDMDRICVLVEFGIEEVHMWYDMIEKKLWKELKILILQQHGQRLLPLKW